MATVNLGRVAYVNKGAYSASTTYTKYDVVSYNNGSYVYWNDADTAGNAPTNTTYWKVMLDPTTLNTAVTNANTATSQANAARDAATAAAAAANTAAANTVNNVKVNGKVITKDASENVDIPLATFSNDGAMSAEDKATLDALANTIEVNDWDDIKNIVTAGAGKRYFPVGTQLTVERDGGTAYTFDVVHHGTVIDPTTSKTKPGMYLLLHNVIYNRQVDAIEALYYVDDAVYPSGMPAGIYHFTIQNYDATYGGNKTYQFTLTSPVPVGGQLVLSWGYNTQILNGNIKSYSSSTSTTVIETVTLSEGSGGDDLGTTDGTNANLNYIQRARYGSNNYKESGIRQWINSSAAANEWWEPTNKFDRPIGYANVDGFLKGMDTKFLAAVGATDIPCKTNNTFELPGWTLNTAYTVRDKFFLASRNEVGYGTEGVAEGSVWELYDGATNADRIKYDISAASTARHWWLRSPYPGNATHVRLVHTHGSLSYYLAYDGYGVVPACIIC